MPIRIIYKKNIELIGRTENISRLGTYLEIDKEITPGTDIDITLEIPVYREGLSLSGKIRCKGNIFRCNLAREVGAKKYYGIGIFFTAFLKDDREKLSKYIDFLITNEDKTVKEGIEHWKSKRKLAKMTKQTRETEAQQKEFQTEAIDLLNKILSRLEEIHRLIQSLR